MDIVPIDIVPSQQTPEVAVDVTTGGGQRVSVTLQEANASGRLDAAAVRARAMSILESIEGGAFLMSRSMSQPYS